MGANHGAQTSVIAADTVLDRRTFMEAVTVKDWNLVFKSGDTCTGTDDTARWVLILGKSLAGTGAVTTIGSAVVGTQADNSVLDDAVTETNFAAGDDIVLQVSAGTILPAGAINVTSDVSYVDRFTA
jgi:hypothetical protein